MPEIVIRNLFNKIINVTDTSKPLLHHFHNNFLDWGQECGGKGRCTTCKLVVVEGSENFLPRTGPEQKYAAAGLLKAEERLACQARINGNIIISVPEECKLKHLQYSG